MTIMVKVKRGTMIDVHSLTKPYICVGTIAVTIFARFTSNFVGTFLSAIPSTSSTGKKIGAPYPPFWGAQDQNFRFLGPRRVKSAPIVKIVDVI
jgi:hypothetical protein